MLAQSPWALRYTYQKLCADREGHVMNPPLTIRYTPPVEGVATTNFLQRALSRESCPRQCGDVDIVPLQFRCYKGSAPLRALRVFIVK